MSAAERKRQRKRSALLGGVFALIVGRAVKGAPLEVTEFWGLGAAGVVIGYAIDPEAT